jgi:mobilization protein
VGREERDGKTVLDLLVDKVPIATWFKEKWEKKFEQKSMFCKMNRKIRL